MLNLLTDIPGLSVGHAQDMRLLSGVTAVLFDRPAVCGVSILGGAPAGRDQECLAPDRMVEGVDAIVLSGGSGFGLDAAGGLQAWLREHGRGYPVGHVKVPIVPQAICFDLLNGGDKDWGRYSPYRELGYEAGRVASGGVFPLGSVGAGLGATTVNFKGGLGSASARLHDGSIVAALMVVNSLGSATVGDGPHFWAAPFEEKDEFGGFGPAPAIGPEQRRLRWKGGPAAPPPATTIGLVATDAPLTKASATRLAQAAHDGFARALRLTHAPADGDTLFAASTGTGGTLDLAELTELCATAADCVARAIARAVFSATEPGNGYAGPPAYRTIHSNGTDRPSS